MKALTIKQPWAWLIIHGHKRVENRPRSTSHRGAFIVHAGRNRDDLRALLASDHYAELQAFCGLPAPDDLTYGAAVGTVLLSDELSLDNYRTTHPLDRFAIGPRCYRLASPTPLASPIPCRGQLGFWTWPDPDLQ